MSGMFRVVVVLVYAPSTEDVVDAGTRQNPGRIFIRCLWLFPSLLGCSENRAVQGHILTITTQQPRFNLMRGAITNGIDAQ